MISLSSARTIAFASTFCAAFVVVLWCRGLNTTDFLDVAVGPVYLEVENNVGFVRLGVGMTSLFAPLEASGPGTIEDEFWRPPRKPKPFGKFVFRGSQYFFFGANSTGRAYGFDIAVPHLVLLAGTSLFPLIWAVRRLRLRHGFCRGCGYDLRATRDRCPECGLVVAPAASIAAGSDAYWRLSRSGRPHEWNVTTIGAIFLLTKLMLLLIVLDFPISFPLRPTHWPIWFTFITSFPLAYNFADGPSADWTSIALFALGIIANCAIWGFLAKGVLGAPLKKLRG